MKQEDKELLLKDLCGRLPYKIRCSYYDICLLAHCNGEICGIENKEYAIVDGKCIAIGFIKPFLFPLSSMTEEQKYELQKIIYVETEIICNQLKTNNYGIEAGKYHFNSTLQVDWLNKNHFDYRGLIPMGLAIDCTNLNIY